MKSPLAQSTARTSLILVLRLIVQASTLLVVARLLGPSEFGVFAGVAALTVFGGALSTFGTNLVLLREVSINPAGGNEVARFAYCTTLIFGGGLFVVIACAGNQIFPDFDSSHWVIVLIGLAELLIHPFLQLVAAELQGRGGIAISQILLTVPLLIRLLGAVTIWLLQIPHPIIFYSLTYFLAPLVVLALTLLSRVVQLPSLSKWRMPTRSELRDSSGFAVLNMTAMGPTELDKVLAIHLLAATTVGLYAASARVVGAMVLPVIALMLSSLPRLFRDAKRAHESSLFWKVLSISSGYGLLAGMLLWFCAPLISTLFGEEYSGIERILRWMVIVVPGMAIRIAATSTLMAQGIPWVRVFFEVVGLVALVVAAFVCTAHYAVTGMVIAVALAEWSMAIGAWGVLVLRHVNRGG